MSRTITVTKAEKREGEVVVEDLAALTRACERLGLDAPVYASDVKLGYNDQRRFSGYKVQLPGWNFPCLFNVSEGAEYWNNWPVFDKDHAEVRAGRRRVGEGGRWGDLKELDKLKNTYIESCNEIMAEQVMDTAAQLGEHVEVIQRSPGRIELMISQDMMQSHVIVEGGETKMIGINGVGTICRDKQQPYEQALGLPVSETPHAEMFANPEGEAHGNA